MNERMNWHAMTSEQLQVARRERAGAANRKKIDVYLKKRALQSRAMKFALSATNAATKIKQQTTPFDELVKYVEGFIGRINKVVDTKVNKEEALAYCYAALDDLYWGHEDKAYAFQDDGGNSIGPASREHQKFAVDYVHDAFDALGRPIKIRFDGDGNPYREAFDKAGRLITKRPPDKKLYRAPFGSIAWNHGGNELYAEGGNEGDRWVLVDPTYQWDGVYETGNSELWVDDVDEFGEDMRQYFPENNTPIG